MIRSQSHLKDLIVDYNNSNKMMRIKHSPEDTSPKPSSDFASYFEEK